jgi:hypothetical protein
MNTLNLEAKIPEISEEAEQLMLEIKIKASSA